MEISNLASICFGFVSLIVYSFSIYFFIKVLKNFKKNENYTLMKFYLDKNVIKVYKILSIASIFFSVGMCINALIRFTEIYEIKFVAYLLMIPLVFSFMYWAKTLEEATSEKALE
ncbi:MAG: hypothetical protein QW412_01175 [Candidatus Aenigmatarchaeota archaeon]